MRTLPSAEINGFTMPYIETGDTGGIPLILIHGLTDSMRSYEPVLAELPDAIHAFAITQRGHGDAGRPADGYGALDLARDVVAFMDAAGIERAVVAGHSHGATIARRVAADYPDRVLGCVLAGAFSPLREQPGLRALLDEFRELGDAVGPAYAGDWQESTLANPVPEAFLEMVVAETCKAPVRVWTAAMQGLLDERREPQPPIAAPTLLAWGEHDAMVSRGDQDDLLGAIPGSRLIVYQGAGHALHWEQPARFAADVAAFAETA
jgi:non-heme chloroperoxidase